MKKILSLLVALLLIGSTAFAAVPQLSPDLLGTAKQALGFLASGEYERLVKLLPFSDVAPSGAEWESFAANFSGLDDVQKDYAVGYWTGAVWKVAVPVKAPDSGEVEALVLTSEDGTGFTGYRYATWSQVETEYGASDHVIWNKEYVDGAPRVFAD